MVDQLRKCFIPRALSLPRVITWHSSTIHQKCIPVEKTTDVEDLFHCQNVVILNKKILDNILFLKYFLKIYTKRFRSYYITKHVHAHYQSILLFLMRNAINIHELFICQIDYEVYTCTRSSLAGTRDPTVMILYFFGFIVTNNKLSPPLILR